MSSSKQQNIQNIQEKVNNKKYTSLMFMTYKCPIRLFAMNAELIQYTWWIHFHLLYYRIHISWKMLNMIVLILLIHQYIGLTDIFILNVTKV
jgi:hypothetical protein